MTNNGTIDIDTTSRTLPSIVIDSNRDKTKLLVSQALSTNLVDRVYPCRSLDTFPFPILNGSVILEGTTRQAVPIEFTPMYYGIPILVKNAKGDVLGGAFIEPLGFCHDENNVIATKSGTITIKHPKSVVSVVEQSGIASHALSVVSSGHLSNKMYVYYILCQLYSNFVTSIALTN